MPDLALSPGPQFAEPLAIGILCVGVALAVAIAALSHSEHHLFSPALVYVGLGLLAALLISATGAKWNEPTRDPELLQYLGEVTLVAALFGAGLKFGERPAWPYRRATFALLLISLPFGIALIALFGFYAMGLSVGAAILLGAALAPTDPVLAGDIGLPSPGEEEESDTRPAHVIISGEAGLNDGLATPFVLLGLLVATEEWPDWIGGWLAFDVAYGIGAGVAIGIGTGYGLGAAFKWLRERELVSVTLETFVALAAAALVYGLTETAGAFGLIAVFVAGIGFRRYESSHEYNHMVHRGTDRLEKLLEFAVIVTVGSIVTFAGLGEPGLSGWLLAPLLLLVIRPLTALPALVGSGLQWRGKAFVTWFGVRGVASVYYAAVIIASGALSSAESTRLFWTIVVVVLVSILVHGVTATPLAALAAEESPRRRPKGV